MIQGLFQNNEIITVGADISTLVGELYPEEESFIANAQQKRRREFTAGRLCAREALSHLGINNFPILVGKNREPIWPPDIIGSLSHCDDYCIAAVAKKGEIISIGVDVESSRALDDEIIDIIATPREKEWLATLADNQQRYWSKIVFSIKESVYKCYFPLAGDFLEFHDVEVILNPESGTFLASIVNPSKKLQLTRLQGRFVTTNQHIFSATTISCAEIEL